MILILILLIEWQCLNVGSHIRLQQVVAPVVQLVSSFFFFQSTCAVLGGFSAAALVAVCPARARAESGRWLPKQTTLETDNERDQSRLAERALQVVATGAQMCHKGQTNRQTNKQADDRQVEQVVAAYLLAKV